MKSEIVKIAVKGAPGSGKTTILRNVERILRKAGVTDIIHEEEKHTISFSTPLFFRFSGKPEVPAKWTKFLQKQ